MPDEIVPVRHQGELLGAWRQLTNSVDTEAAAVQLGGNALLLMPFGFVAPIRWPALANLWRILLATLAFGVLIEGLQFAAGFGRVASATDVLLYTIGGLLGYSLFRASRAFAGARFDGRRVTTTIELTRRVAQDRLSSDHLQGELASASRHYSLSWHPFRPGLTCNVKKEEARSG